VLFPQGLLPLRVFEMRYLDMVRDCLRNNTPFGVVNIVSGNEESDGVDDLGNTLKKPDNAETDTPSLHPSVSTASQTPNDATVASTPIVGTLATVVDFDMVDPAILMIAVKGGQRFKVLHTHTQADGLLRAEVELLPALPETALQDDDRVCVALLKRIIEELESQHKEAEESGQKTFCFPIEKPYQLHDAGWIAHRFAEIMPISLKHKQLILQLNDAQSRLNWVINFLKNKDVV
jgi:Lon protease-like protein